MMYGCLPNAKKTTNKISEVSILIEVKSIVKKYGTHTAVNNLSFSIEPGKIYGFLGPNGAGKSTTMNIITGTLAATSGTVLVNGHDIYDDPIEAKKSIGYLPEIPPLYTDMTPLEYLTFVAEAKGVDYDRISRRVKEVMELTQITEVKDRLIRNLSKGYKQRVGIAMAMLGDPDVIILDEPTVGLDPIQIIEIRQLIKKLGQTKTVILSSHILAEIAEVCDHVMIISHGNLVANDTIENLEATVNRSDTLHISIRGNASEAIKVINGCPGVIETSADSLSAEEGVCKLTVTVEKNSDPRDEIFYKLADQKLPIVALELEKVTLESIFVALTRDDESDPESEDTDDVEPCSVDYSENGTNDSQNNQGEDKKDKDGDDYKPLFS